jgi:hypothetical protein
MSVSTARRRERGRNATFSLHPDALRAIDELMAAGRAPSKNALVEGLVLREWRRLAQERRDAARLQAYQEAMHDPLFLADLAEVERAFATADAETARQIE